MLVLNIRSLFIKKDSANLFTAGFHLSSHDCFVKACSKYLIEFFRCSGNVAEKQLSYLPRVTVFSNDVFERNKHCANSKTSGNNNFTSLDSGHSILSYF